MKKSVTKTAKKAVKRGSAVKTKTAAGRKAGDDRIVSIIIPAFNSTHTLMHTMPSILAQEGDYIKDIIVVDSSDNGRMESFIARYKNSGILFITSGLRIMPAVQRNIGAKAASGELLVFLDSDVILKKDYIAKIVARYRSGITVGFGSIELPEFQKKKLIPVAQYYLQLNEYIPHGKDRTLPYLTGCNNFITRELFDTIGGYPEIRAAEDVLYGFNITKHTPIRFIIDATVDHIFREDWKGFADNQKLLGRFVAKYRREHSNSIIFKGIMPIILFPAFLVLKLARIIPRILVTGPYHTFQLVKIFPLFFMGLIYWTIGFTKGALDKNT